ncbi:hypothetical protein Tco_0273759 [Tanacetum coccineum]
MEIQTSLNNPSEQDYLKPILWKGFRKHGSANWYPLDTSLAHVMDHLVGEALAMKQIGVDEVVFEEYGVEIQSPQLPVRDRFPEISLTKQISITNNWSKLIISKTNSTQKFLNKIAQKLEIARHVAFVHPESTMHRMQYVHSARELGHDGNIGQIGSKEFDILRHLLSPRDTMFYAGDYILLIHQLS